MVDRRVTPRAGSSSRGSLGKEGGTLDLAPSEAVGCPSKNHPRKVVGARARPTHPNVCPAGRRSGRPGDVTILSLAVIGKELDQHLTNI